jgi:excisionase family DNA binding protein
MTEMLTAKDMQELLQVDRSTIYRMAEAGRLPAVKVGKQWRFPSDLVNGWLNSQAATPTLQSQPVAEKANCHLDSLLPMECVQLIQDTYADALGVMLVITDMEGNPVTEVSHPCGLFEAISQKPDAVKKCIESWHSMAKAIELEPKWMPTHLGLLCARGLIRVGTELKGMVIMGCVAPDRWPPAPEEINKIATEFGLKADELTPRVEEAFFLDKAQQARVLSFVQRIANVVAHIATERNTLMGKLESIAKLAA